MARHYSFLRSVGYLLLGIAGLLTLVLIGIILLIGTPFFAAELGSFLTHRTGRSVSLQGHITTHLWQREPEFILSGIKVGNAAWSSAPEMFSADRLVFTIRPLELLRLRVVLPELELDKPVVLLEKNEQGEANWQFGSNPQAAVVKAPVPDSRGSIPIIGQLKIANGSLTYHDPKKGIMTTVDISTVVGSEGGEHDDVSVSGKGDYQHQPFTLSLHAASMLDLRESDKPYPFRLSVTSGDTGVDAKGSVQDPVTMTGLDVQLDVRGKNAADIYPLTGIVLPPTPPYRLSGHLTQSGVDFTFKPFSGTLGSSDLHGDLAWHPDQKPPYFNGNFISDNLDIKDLKGFIGADKTPSDPNRVIPDTSLDITRLLAMNADVTFRGEHIREPQILTDMFMKIALHDGVLTVDPVSFGIAKGKIDADIKIEGKKTPPHVTLDIGFHHLSLTDLFAPLAKSFGEKNVSAGSIGGLAKLDGNGKSLRDMLATSNGTIGVGMEGGELSRLLLELAGIDILRSAGLILTDSDQPIPINCVIGDFLVNDGVMESRNLVIDTNVNTVRGEGNVDLRDETLQMSLHVTGKETALSARTPILIKGTFKHPSIGLDAVKLAERGAVATALGFLAPPAALLAFVEPGLGEESHCASYIRQLSHMTGADVPHNRKGDH